MSNPNVFRRPVSPTERLYLSAREITPPFAIGVVVEGEGHIAVAELRRAVDAASRACPGARLVLDGDSWVDSGVTPHVEELSGRVDWNALDADPILHRPIGATGEATTEVVLVHDRESETTTLIFRAFHGVMDGGGIVLWASDVLRVLRGHEPIGAGDPVADVELVARLDTSGAPTRLLPNRPSPFGRTVPDGGPTFLLRHRSVAARASSTVARVSAVIADLCSGAARIMVPVDLRRHDPQLRSTANLALPLFLDVERMQGWEAINASLIRGMLERRELNEMEGSGLAVIPPRLARGLLRSAHTIGVWTGRSVASAIVSHAGALALEQFASPGFAPTSVRVIPAASGLVPVSFAIVEHDGGTEITVSARGGRGVREHLEQLLDRIETELVVAGSAPLPGRSVVPAQAITSIDVADASSTVRTAAALFGQRVREGAEDIAVSAPEGTYTYGELDRRSDVVAAELLHRGVSRGDIVAVLADRTINGAIAQLGVMKTGASFLPFDSHHPASRISASMSDSRARLALVERAYRDMIAESGADTVILEDLAEPDQLTPDTRAAIAACTAEIDPADAVYVTYTSGSTGRPKGVPVPNVGLLNYVAAATQWYQLGPQTRFGHYHTPAADMACAAFFSALLTGATLTLLPDDVSPVSLQYMLTESGANTYLLTPSLVLTITRLGIEVTSARTVIIGGEKLYSSLARAARELFGPTPRIVNAYGPTELSIICTNYEIGGVDDIDVSAESVPIGHASAGTPVFLLDEDGRSVPDGSVGELYFGGPQVAIGYLGQPELTAQRFVTVAGQRTYRTGDLARVNTAGALEFVGRVDDQVKVRGNRIEPGEVQAALETHSSVAACAVVPRKRADGSGVMLVGYIIAQDSNGELDIRDLRTHLAAQVPTYMIPAALIAVPDLPVTLNGKLDVASLPLPVAASGDDRSELSAVATNLQVTDVQVADAWTTQWRAIAQIWSDVLGVETATLTDDSDFFVLGGDSLAAVEMLARVSREVVASGRAAEFVAALDGFAHELMLGRVHDAALLR